MNVRIRPQWVLGLVILVVMFIAARLYVGQAIQRESEPRKTVRDTPPPPRVQPRDAPSPRPEKRLTASNNTSRVRLPLLRLDLAIEAENDTQRQAIYAQLREDLSAVTQEVAQAVPPSRHAQLLEHYERVIATEAAAPVRDDLTKMRDQLKTWFAAAPSAPETAE